VVVLTKKNIEVAVALAYVQAVYRTGLQGAEWIIDLNCYLTKHRQRALIAVTKQLPDGRRNDSYRLRGLADEE
jgi:hypothetical protein